MNLILPKERNLYLVKQIDQESINNITKDIVNINENDLLIQKVYRAYGLGYNPAPIKLFIDSYGGHVYQAAGLGSVIEKSKTDVHTIVTGCAMSAGFYLLVSGKRRFAYNDATILYHQLSAGTSGKLEEMKDYVNQLDILDKKLRAHYLRKTSMGKKLLDQLNKNKTDYYMSAQQALKLNCIEEIL